jgi:hypothetical protein
MKRADVHTDEDVLPAPLILKVLGGVVVLGVMLCVVAWLLLGLRERQLRPSRKFPERELRAPERAAEIRQYMFERTQPLPGSDDELLRTYGWVDRERGIARIPIDVAIDLTLKGVKP